jgi:hypothetical protein
VNARQRADGCVRTVARQAGGTITPLMSAAAISITRMSATANILEGFHFLL